MSQRSNKNTRQGKATMATPPSAPTLPVGDKPGVGRHFLLESESSPSGLNERWLVLGVCIFLAVIVWVVFGQTLHHEFVNYDDETYVVNTPAILDGLSLKGIVWAFTHNVNVNWTPLVVISHMLDCQLYGTNAGWHHLTSVLLHMASAIVLFLVLKGMTAALWRSAFVAAVFAVHPLHVESVAWIAERRDVLSGLFFMLTLGAYARYVRHPQFLGRYLMVALMLSLALMSKPMVVTLPFVLLLLDYWPLKRFTQPAGRLIPWRLIVEKIPLLALSGAACAATFIIFAQRNAIPALPLSLRIGNALVSYVAYLRQMVFPVGLAVYYPHPGSSLPIWKIIAAFVLLLVISAGAIAARRKRPWFLFGWLWYLGMLVPVIGVLQVGLHARADRYTYLSQIGLYMLLTWAAADLCTGLRHRRLVLGGCATAILTALIFCAYTQTTYWRNSVSLWTHALACTPDNAIARYSLGDALLKKGSLDEAIIQYQKALQIIPSYADAHISLGIALLQKGSVDEAITHYQKALQIEPGYAKAHNNLGIALFQKKNVAEAITHYQKALQIKPDFEEAHNNLGNALLQEGSADEAIAHYQKALQIKPDYAEAHINLGNALFKKGSAEGAIPHFQKALLIKPDSLEILNNLAWLLATCPDAHLRDGVQAVQYAERACELTHYGVTATVGTLAAAYAEAGRFDDAIAAAQKACALATAAGEQDLLDKNQKLLVLYRGHQPYHEAVEKHVPAAP
jgi:tetratricopeptide (TPR) repeat protein